MTKEEEGELKQLKTVLREQMASQINNVLDVLGAEKIKTKAVDEDGDGYDDETGEYIDEYIDYEALEAAAHVDDDELATQTAVMTAILAYYMLAEGQKTYKDGYTLLENRNVPQNQLDLATGYAQIGKQTKDSYEAYLRNTLSEYFGENQKNIIKILRRSKLNGYTTTQLTDKLRGMMNTDEWRIQRLARSEIHRANTLAQVDSMSSLQAQTGVRIYKEWVALPSACDYCKEMDKRKVAVDTAFLVVGGEIDLGEKGTFVNDFMDIEGAELHPNCQCELHFTLEGNE